MEYNAEFKILFEKSILIQLFDAYRFDFKGHELVDEVYSKVRTYNPDEDVVDFVYSSRSDYSRLVRYILSKLNRRC